MITNYLTLEKGKNLTQCVKHIGISEKAFILSVLMSLDILNYIEGGSSDAGKTIKEVCEFNNEPVFAFATACGFSTNGSFLSALSDLKLWGVSKHGSCPKCGCELFIDNDRGYEECNANDNCDYSGNFKVETNYEY